MYSDSYQEFRSTQQSNIIYIVRLFRYIIPNGGAKPKTGCNTPAPPM